MRYGFVALLPVAIAHTQSAHADKKAQYAWWWRSLKNNNVSIGIGEIGYKMGREPIECVEIAKAKLQTDTR